MILEIVGNNPEEFKDREIVFQQYGASPDLYYPDETRNYRESRHEDPKMAKTTDLT